MSRLPSVVSAIANEEGRSVRTVQRRLKAGKYKGAYRTRGGHWRLRKPRRRQRQQWNENAYWRKDDEHRFPLRVPREQWEQWKKNLVAGALRRLMVLVPQRDKAYHAKARKLACLYAGITADDVSDVLQQPDPLTRRGNRAALKRRDYRKWQLLCQRKYVTLSQQAELLRVNGAKVTRRSLASALGMSVMTLDRRYGRDAVREACQEPPVRELPRFTPPPGQLPDKPLSIWQRAGNGIWRAS